MAIVNMVLTSIQWDTSADTATLTFVGDDVPAPPDLPGQWRPGNGSTVTMTVPIRRRQVTSDHTGIMLTNDAAGNLIYTRYEWDERRGEWRNPTRVFSDGSPYIA